MNPLEIIAMVDKMLDVKLSPIIKLIEVVGSDVKVIKSVVEEISNRLN